MISQKMSSPAPAPLPFRDSLSSLEGLRRSDEVLAKLALTDWSFAKSSTGYLSHDIHPYPAKFIPQIPETIIAELSLPGELVWDPFGGSGTTALEAILACRRCVSTDANPLAEIIGSAKTSTLRLEHEDVLRDFLEQLSLVGQNPEMLGIELRALGNEIEDLVPDIPNIDQWFATSAITELAYLRKRIADLTCEQAQKLAVASFSKILVRASFQDEETRYARRPRLVRPGEIILLFTAALKGTLEKAIGVGSLLSFRTAEFHTLDLRDEAKVEEFSCVLSPGSVDLIVTSPPYPNTTDYHLYHRFRLFWLGFDPRHLAKIEIGSHLRHQKENSGFESYVAEMTLCLKHMLSRLRPGRFAVLVLGDGKFGGETYSTRDHLADVASQIGFEVTGHVDRELPLHKRSFAKPARRLKTESLLILRKPAETTRLRLGWPAYKLKPYERVLREAEVESLFGDPVQANGSEVVTDSLKLDRARRLTFVTDVSSSSIGLERTWQAILENGEATSSKRKDPKYATHGIHPYKGKFYPQLAKSLVNIAGIAPGSLILDPFCGSGTVLLEAYLNGHNAFGVDINLIAVKTARAKTEILKVDPFLRDRILGRFALKIEHRSVDLDWRQSFPEENWPALMSWFPEPVLMKIGSLLNEINQITEPRVRELLEVLVSSIVRDISQQEPKDLRIRRRKTPIADAPVFELFLNRLRETRERLRQFANRLSRAPVTFGSATSVHGDSRGNSVFDKAGVQPGSVDGIVTSPPYATALPYIDTDRLSLLALCGLDSSARGVLEKQLVGSREINEKTRQALDAKIRDGDFADVPSEVARKTISRIWKLNCAQPAGFRRMNTPALLYRYYQDLHRVMIATNRLLREGASAFFVIGDNRTTAGGQSIRIRSGEILQELGDEVGWTIKKVFPITVTTEDRLHAKNSITENEIIWFRKS